MLLDLAAGVVLIAGSFACAAAAFLGRPRVVWLLAAAGLACAARRRCSTPAPRALR
jgi:hypothetical protein